ncbi:MAG: hypothetical protein IPL40_10185 [Proteobacteria bacterium]|nr:hypothetical protein [Pseudomonadota bacterium]
MSQVIEQGDVRMTIDQRADAELTEIVLSAQGPGPLVLHWGLRLPGDGRWHAAPPECWPAGSVAVGEAAVQTPLAPRSEEGPLVLRLPAQGPWAALTFVLLLPDRGRWVHHHGGDFVVPLRSAGVVDGPSAPVACARLVEEIVAHELGRSSWTLMHRYQLCHALIEGCGADADALAYLFVWLRFSALRQLDWQRRYNTKPRELAHAQQRLGELLVQRFAGAPRARPLVRLLLGTVGAANEGQRIRDEILEIMHRHRIKEVAGHFLEEWHQKLHNNTTPDDVAIAEAYLAFLRSDGDLLRYWAELQRHGVTRQRLESYERPIRSAPDFVPGLKAGLAQDIEHFAGTLRALHEANDLAAAAAAARESCDPEDRQRLAWLLSLSRPSPADGGARGIDRATGAASPSPAAILVQVVEAITVLRRNLARRLAGGETVRALLYLDLALEDHLRLAVERWLDADVTLAELVVLVEHVLENLGLSSALPELELCRRHWRRISADGTFDADRARHARAVVERVARAVGGEVDAWYALLQPKAEQLGVALRVEAWVISLFSEEVVRGRPSFVIAALLRHLDPLLRAVAALGDWQVVSPGRGEGELRCVDTLRELQLDGQRGPLVVLSRSVGGDEEIPEQVTAVITPMPTDLVSHVAVRARNAGLLFATCYAPQKLSELEALQGRQVRLEVDARGDVVVAALEGATAAAATPRAPLVLPAVDLSGEDWVLPLARCGPDQVGAKARGLLRLAAVLPSWAIVPPAVAVPFGGLERALALPANAGRAEEYAERTRRADEGAIDVALLSRLRALVLELEAPAALAPALKSALAAVGVPLGDALATSWMQIKRVWASKWNERAYQARQHWQLAHRAVHLAVLIQPLVPADHAFVLHSVNPADGNARELYLELVPGLGETLVGNHPGRALAVVVDKARLGDADGGARIVAYPSKSEALSARGLIYRSDANAEDLAGYAGAGLYDSVTAEAPTARLLDYTEEPLLWDAARRLPLVRRIAEIGLSVERAFGTPQDIEGVISEGRLYVVQARPQVGL